jgi:SAM-dependent methyltransferase
MAEFGFTVLGIDFSPAAIQAAIRNAEIGKVRNIMFKASDILNFRPEQPFDLVYDYSVFHHISRAGRQAYAKTASAAVRPGGFLALVCYSDGNPAEGFDADRQRTGKLGNTIFHLAFDEVMEIFNEDFRLSAYRESRLGPECTHHAHHFIFRRYQVAGSRVHQDTSASSGQRGSR